MYTVPVPVHVHAPAQAVEEPAVPRRISTGNNAFPEELCAVIDRVRG